jgi:hypothetical protein
MYGLCVYILINIFTCMLELLYRLCVVHVCVVHLNCLTPFHTHTTPTVVRLNPLTLSFLFFLLDQRQHSGCFNIKQGQHVLSLFFVFYKSHLQPVP